VKQNFGSSVSPPQFCGSPELLIFALLNLKHGFILLCNFSVAVSQLDEVRPFSGFGIETL
jgi:hypothetical protein